MKSYNVLTEAQLAEHYLAHKGGARGLPMTARSLHEDVKQYLRSRGMEHRVDDAVAIAIAAYEMAQVELQPVATPEQSAWQNDVQQGIGDRLPDELAMRQMDDLALAGQVRAMRMPEFAASRQRLGLTQDLSSFLGGAE